MKLNKFLELVVAALAIVGLLTLIAGSQTVATILFTAAMFAVLVLFLVMSMGYMLIASIIFLIYGANTYLI